MGNFHCIPESCGRVVYREYLPPVVRWRYPGEQWQEIEGDDYSIDERPAQCCGSWDITVEYYVPGCNRALDYSGTRTVRIPYGKYRRLEYQLDNPFVRTQIAVIYWDCWQNKEKSISVWSSTGKSSVIPDCGDPTAIHNQPGSTYEIVDLVRVDGGSETCTECTFTVYKNQEVVHSEQREDCPEVEVLPCRLSDVVKEIRIEKIPYLERIEVVDYSYISFGGNIFRGDIPDECLNVIKNLTTQIVPLPDGILTPDNGAFNSENRGFIAQICSASGCPPPEFSVICDCECESCPDGTCPVDCGDHICCYEASGVAVKSIPLENYCDKSE